MLLRETKYACIFLMMWLFCSKMDSSTIQSKKNLFTRHLSDDRNTTQSIDGIFRMATDRSKTVDCNSMGKNMPDSQVTSMADFHRRVKRCGGTARSTFHPIRETSNRSNRSTLQRPKKTDKPLLPPQVESNVAKKHRKIDHVSNKAAIIQRSLPKTAVTANPKIISKRFERSTTISEPIVDGGKIEVKTQDNFETRLFSKSKYSTDATTVTEEISVTDYPTAALAIDDTTTADTIFTVAINTVEHPTSGPIVGDTLAGPQESKKEKCADLFKRLKKVMKGESPKNRHHFVKFENNRREALEGGSDTRNSSEPAKTVITSDTLVMSTYDTNTGIDEKTFPTTTNIGKRMEYSTRFDPIATNATDAESFVISEPIFVGSALNSTVRNTYAETDNIFTELLEEQNTEEPFVATVTDTESADSKAFNNMEALDRTSANLKAKGTKSRLPLNYGTNDPPLNPNDNWRSSFYNDYSTLEGLKTILYADASHKRGTTKKGKSSNRVQLASNSNISDGKFSIDEDNNTVDSVLKNIEKNSTFNDTSVNEAQSNETIVGMRKNFSSDHEFNMANLTDTSSNITSPIISQPSDFVSMPFDKLIQNTTKGNNILIISGVNNSVLKAILELLHSNKSTARRSDQTVEPHRGQLPVTGRQARKNKPVSKKGYNDDDEEDESYEDPRDEELKNRFYFVNPKILQNFIGIYKKYSSGMR